MRRRGRHIKRKRKSKREIAREPARETDMKTDREKLERRESERGHHLRGGSWRESTRGRWCK